jgi:hypothetical protein
MLKKTIAVLVALAFSLVPGTLMTQKKAEAKTKKWNPAAKKSMRRAQLKRKRIVTANGKRALVGKNGMMYLLTNDGKRFVVDQKGNKIRVNKAGKMILIPAQKRLKLRLGPGPVA